MPVYNETPAIKSKTIENKVFSSSKKSAIVLLVGSVALGILVTLAGIGLFSSSAPHWLTHAIGTIGNSGTGVFLFGGGILACAGGISGIILFVKSSGKKKESIEDNDSPPTETSQIKPNETSQPTEISKIKTENITHTSELHTAVWKGSQSKVNKVLNKEDIDVNIFENGKTALHVSIGLMKTKKDFAIFETLVSHQKVDVNRETEDGITPLLLAVQYGCIEAIELLLSRNDIKKENILEIVGGFLKIENKVNKLDDDDNLNIFNSLLNCQHFDVNFQSAAGYSALLFAVIFGNEKGLKILLEHTNINFSLKDSGGDTALHIALRINKKIFELLLNDKRVDPNIKDKEGNTPLHIALERDITFLELLLNHEKADINVTDENGDTLEARNEKLKLSHKSREAHCKKNEELILAHKQRCKNEKSKV